MRNWMAASLVGAMVLSSAAQAQTPAAPDPETTVEDVVVIGGRVAPTTADPKSASCEFLAATDPFLRAQIDVARRGGDPFSGEKAANDSPNAMQAPRILQPTRFPLNVDPTATPLSTPGSDLPPIGRQYRGISARTASTADSGDGSRRLYGVSSPQEVQYRLGLTQAEDTLPNFSGDDAIDACRFLRTMGGATVQVEGEEIKFGSGEVAAVRTGAWSADWGSGKYEVAYRDKSLPTAFALFQEHRYAESLDYFHQAFEKLSYDQGGDEAALMIGKLMLGAPGVERDMAGAVTWLTKAAGAKFDRYADMPIFDPKEPTRNTAIGEAAMILGYLYQSGAGGMAKDPKLSRKWFDRANAVGHVRACLALGDTFYYGVGVPQDLKLAFKYYKEGATLGDAPAQQALAEMYYAGEAPGGRDLRIAAAWHNEAAKLGHAPSLYALGAAYETGEGVAVDPQKALGLYKLAAMEGDPAARNAIGAYFYEGRQLPKDPVMARRWFQEAAVYGDPDAMFNLGAMMMKGEGGDADRTRAWVWLTLAQRGQHPQAQTAVRVLETQMTADEKAEALKLASSATS